MTNNDAYRRFAEQHGYTYLDVRACVDCYAIRLMSRLQPFGTL
jgi:hypothetical protein